MTNVTEPRPNAFMELPLDERAVVQAFNPAHALSAAFGEGYAPYYSTRDKLVLAVRMAPLAGRLIQEVADGTETVTLADVAKVEPIVRQFMPRRTRESLGAWSQADLASSVILGAARGAIRSQDAKRIVSPLLAKARPYIETLTSGEGPRAQFEREVSTFLGTVQDAARHAATARRRAEGTTKPYDPARPDRYVGRRDVAMGIKYTLERMLKSEGQMPLLDRLVTDALQKSGMTRSEVAQFLKPEYLTAAADMVVRTFNSVLPTERRFTTLERTAGEFSKEALFASLWPGKGVSRKFNALHANLPALMKALHGLLPATNAELLLPYQRLEKAFRIGKAAGHTATTAATTD